MATNVTLSGSVRSNLLALQKTQTAIDVTNSRLNTGKKVNTVIDDAVAFFSAKALDDRASDFNERKANIDQAISAINTALTATTAIDSLLKQLKGIATSAKSATSIERGTLQTQYNTVKAQIDQLVSDASYQGLNLVSNSTSVQTTQFSDRSSSRLVVTAQRLSTYGAGLASQVASNVNSVGTLSNAAGSALGLTVGAVGQYFVKGATSAGALLTFNLVRYDAASTVGGDTASFNLTTISARTSQTFAAATASIIQDTYNVVSGLNVFAASQVYIVVDANLTGSFAISTVSAGTLWSAAAFDVNQTINANDSFNEALDFVISGLNNSISQNNSVAKALGTNVAILNTRLEFTKEYVDVQKDGAGKLTLADTNEEGANLVSLQTRQQLGIQALAFAGQTEQSVLRLFG